MENRKLGRTDLDVGVIGLGTEHLERKPETLDTVLRLAVEAGVSYVDLLYVETDYWDEFGPVYRSYRDKLVMAAHWASGPCCDLDFCQSTFANILSSVGNDYVEVALMTMIDEKDRQGAAREVANRIVGLGVLQPFLDEDDIEEVIVRNGFVMTEREGQIRDEGDANL